MKKYAYIPLLLAAVLCPHVSLAQEGEKDRTVEESIPKRVTSSSKDDMVTLVVENDSIGGGSDQNYTSGVRLTYLDVSSNFPEIAHRIDDLVPTFDINDTSSVFYSIGQNMFTPEEIERREQNEDDRPWAGFTYASIGMTSYTGNHTDEIEATIGVVGPAALTEQAQKFIHNHVSNSPSPKGWSNQLKNEPALMLGWQRAWPQYAARDVGPVFVALAPYYGLTLGNVYTFAAGGVTARIGPGSEKWQDMPVRVRPSLPGTGFFEIPESGWSWYLFGGLEGRAVARNIFLDGNTFTDSHSVDKEFLVGDVNAGLAVTKGQARLSYTIVYRTEEFETQEDPTVFGAVSLSYRF